MPFSVTCPTSAPNDTDAVLHRATRTPAGPWPTRAWGQYEVYGRDGSLYKRCRTILEEWDGAAWRTLYEHPFEWPLFVDEWVNDSLIIATKDEETNVTLRAIKQGESTTLWSSNEYAFVDSFASDSSGVAFIVLRNYEHNVAGVAKWRVGDDRPVMEPLPGHDYAGYYNVAKTNWPNVLVHSATEAYLVAGSSEVTVRPWTPLLHPGHLISS